MKCLSVRDEWEEMSKNFCSFLQVFMLSDNSKAFGINPANGNTYICIFVGYDFCMFLKKSLMSPRLHSFDQNYSINSNIAKLYYIGMLIINR